MYHKGNYSNMNNYFDKINWDNFFENLNVDECYNKWLQHYDMACTLLIPQSNINKIKRVPWLNKKLAALIKLNIKLWITCRNSKFRDQNLLREYKNLNKVTKTTVKSTIREYEYEIVHKAKENPKLIYQYLNSKTKINQKISALEIEDGTISIIESDITKVLNNFFHSVFQKENDNVPTFNKALPKPIANPEINIDTVIKKLSKLNVNKSTVEDKVHTRVLKKCSNSISNPLIIIFN
nr:uncharacterized protein LOC101241704 [Hydra vulgaris]